MNKVFRSLLWSGIAAVGLAGCGDDVTVTEPPPPPVVVPQVRSVTVTPDGASVGAGSTIQMSANVTADAGATVTVAWSTSDATRATVSASGLVTIPGNAAVGAVSIKATATAGTSTAAGAATLNVVGTTVTGVTVSPPAVTLNAATAISAAQSITATATVDGTNNPSQAVTWTSLDPAIATAVAGSGVITAVAPGTVNVKACSNADSTKCGFIAVTVVVPQPALVQIQAVTFNNGTNNVPVSLTNVFGQIEIVLNVDNGSRVITRVDALIGGQVVASQTFSSTSKAQAGPALAATTVSLSTNTRQLRKNGGIFIPVIFNGNSQITANLYVAGSSAPIASNAIPVVMNNADGVVQKTGKGTLVPTSLTPSAVSNIPGEGGHTYYKGTQDVSGFTYLAFGTTVPEEFFLDSDVCRFSENLISGTPGAATGIPLAGIFDCAGVQGGNGIYGFFETTYPVGAVGPDGTPLQPPTNIANVGSAFQVPTGTAGVLDDRWNMIETQSVDEVDSECGFSLCSVSASVKAISGKAKAKTAAVKKHAAHVVSAKMQAKINAGKAIVAARAAKVRVAGFVPALPVFVGPGPTYVDNQAPSVGIDNVAFNDNFDQQWVNASYAFSQDLIADDAGIDFHGNITGVGLNATSPEAHKWDNTAPACTSNVVVTGNDFAETVTSSASQDGVFICTFAADQLDNSASSGASNAFGVDKLAPDVRLAGSTAATPTLGASTTASVSASANTSIYGNSGLGSPFPAFPATDVWGLEGLDGRSGFNQNNVSGFPAVQNIVRLANSGSTTCATMNYGSNVNANVMSTNLSDTYVRTTVLAALDCALGIGYYTYTGYVVDRAGNQSVVITRNFARDDVAAPNIGAVSPATVPMTPGAPASFAFTANDDLEVVDGTVSLTQTVGTTASSITYPIGSLQTFGTKWDAILTNIITAQPVTITYFFFRIDQSCGAGFTPASCPAPAVTTLAPIATNVADYSTGAAALPTAVTGQASDVADQLSAVSPAFTILAQYFSPSTGILPPWTGVSTAGTQDLVSWVGDVTTAPGSATARHTALTSVPVAYFENAGLWRQNLTGGIVFCGNFPGPVRTDAGTYRYWTYTLVLPSTGPCTGAAFAASGNWRAIGAKTGAGISTPQF